MNTKTVAILVGCLVLISTTASFARGGGKSYSSYGSSSSSHYVRGYTRSNGTYVAPHYRTNRNSTMYDNYSTKGNVNPYTGTTGTITPRY